MLVTKNINLTDTTLQTVIDVPASFQLHLKTVYIVNSGDTDNDVTLVVNKVPDPDGRDTEPDLYIYNEHPVVSKDTLVLGDPVHFILNSEESLKASTKTAGDVEVAVTFELVYIATVLNNFFR
jgi:hypothetical protein